MKEKAHGKGKGYEMTAGEQLDLNISDEVEEDMGKTESNRKAKYKANHSETSSVHK